MIRPIRSAAVGLLLVASLAACSGTAAAPSGVATLASQAPDASGSAEPSASFDPETAQLEFAQCMRDHGIDMPDPESVPGGGFTQRLEGGKDDAEKMQAAQEACDDVLAKAGAVRGELDPEQLDKMVKFAQCMREHGIDMPDPPTDVKGGIVFRPNNSDGGDDAPGKISGDGIDPESEEFQAAQEACGPILGSMGPDGGPSFQSAPEPAKP